MMGIEGRKAESARVRLTAILEPSVVVTFFKLRAD